MIFIRRNRSKVDCGVVAAYNATSWRRTGLTYEEVEAHARACGYSRTKGIHRFQFHRLIHKLNLSAKKVARATSEDTLEELLFAGYLLVFLYQPAGMNWGHAISAFVDQDGEIRLINPDGERPTWEDFAEELSTSGVKHFEVYAIPSKGSLQNDNTRTS